MSISGDYFDEGSDLYLDDKEVREKINECKKCISEGATYSHIEIIDEVIQLCLEYDFTEDGLYLTNSLLEVAPYNSELWQSKGIFLNNLFEFEEAYQCFNKAISLNPNDVDTLMNKSVTEDNLGMFNEAVESLEKALCIEPYNEEIFFNLGVLYEKKEM